MSVDSSQTNNTANVTYPLFNTIHLQVAKKEGFFPQNGVSLVAFLRKSDTIDTLWSKKQKWISTVDLINTKQIEIWNV